MPFSVTNSRGNARMRHDKIEGYVLQARKALAEKNPFDYERALNQISQVIGLRGSRLGATRV
jgi:hypothetical protein